MNITLTLRILGALLLFLAIALLFPLPFSWIYADGASGAFILSSVISAGCGGLLFSQFRSEKELSVREGFAIVTFGWTFFALFGALPFVFSGAIPSYLNAFFETMSGFTTTGSTILTDIEAMPPSLLLWRSLTQWLGGMGIIVLSLAILPMLGVGGMQLFKAEVPGPTADRLKPRIQDTAKLLWGVYVLLTCLEILLADGRRHEFLRRTQPLFHHHGHRRFFHAQRFRRCLRQRLYRLGHYPFHVPRRGQLLTALSCLTRQDRRFYP